MTKLNTQWAAWHTHTHTHTKDRGFIIFKRRTLEMKILCPSLYEKIMFWFLTKDHYVSFGYENKNRLYTFFSWACAVQIAPTDDWCNQPTYSRRVRPEIYHTSGYFLGAREMTQAMQRENKQWGLMFSLQHFLRKPLHPPSFDHCMVKKNSL